MTRDDGFVTIPTAAKMLRTTLSSVRRLFVEKEITPDCPKVSGIRLLDRPTLVRVHDMLVSNGVIEYRDEIDSIRDAVADADLVAQAREGASHAD